ncbi:MAG: cobalamin biosynthesis protein, partial [Rhizobiales bacterium]|nr:cobalamin biosynthesis protein [Hyphomicrobiales bacterium]
ARITGLLIGLAADLSPRFSGNAARRAIARDAHNHLSPNAGWPEAALAGALGISLGGPRNYHGHKTELAWMGDGRTELSANDIDEGLKLYNIGLNITVALVAFAALIVFAA